MIVREALPGDIEPMVMLLAQLFSIEQDFNADGQRQRAGLLMIIDSAGAALLVAEHRGMVVGMISCQLLISTAEGGPSLLVEDLVVSEAERGRGFGKALLHAAANWGESRGASRLQLLADRSNIRGLDFYRNQGLETTSLICLRKFLAVEPIKSGKVANPLP